VSSRCEQQMCRMYCTAEGSGGRRRARMAARSMITPKGSRSRHGSDMPVLMGDGSRISSDSGYPIHIPYDLCTLTMYHR
jgi:hypothetical protein